MARETFWFDAEQCAYVPLRAGARSYARRFLGAALLSVLTAFGLYLALNATVGDPREIWLLYEQKQTSGRINQLNRELARIEQDLNRIHHNDQSFYKSILNKKPIDPSIWEGGTGGAAKVVPASLSLNVVNELAERASRLKFKFNIQQQSIEETRRIALRRKHELTHVPAITPLNGRIVSAFGYRADPFHGHSHMHSGVDIVAPMGTPIRAVGDGVVNIAGTPEWGYGLQVQINHGYGYETKYAHLSRLNVALGQEVKRGDIIGYSGNSGYSTGPHLHYEVIKHGTKVDPSNYMYFQ